MKTSKTKTLLRLMGVVKPLNGYVFIASIFGVIGHLCATFISIIAIQYALEHIGFNINLLVSSIMFIILGLLRGVFRYIEQYFNHYIAFKTLAHLRDKVFVALQKLCPAKLDGEDRGNLISLITTDIELLEVFYAHTLSPIIIAITYSIIMVIFIGQYNSNMAILAISGYTLIGIVVPLIFSKRSANLAYDYRNTSGKLGGYVLDSIRGKDELLQYNQVDNRLDKLMNQMKELEYKEVKLRKLQGRSQGINQSIILLVIFGVMALGLHLVYFKSMSIDALVIIVVSILVSFGPVMALGDLGVNLQNTIAAGRRLLELLDEVPETNEVVNQVSQEFDGINLDGVTFGYNKRKILNDINIQFNDTGLIGIMGESGSGKSTLLKLMMYFWKVNDGEILINKTNINKINTSELRSFQSYMTQETQLFKDTIKNNLKIAKLNASDDEIIEACKKARIHEHIISLQKGYDTLVEELEDNFSGGQRQRLGLARSLLHDAKCLLLDEPTSNLDSINEAEILKALIDIKEDKLVVLVSHRPNTLEICDKRYLVLGEGICES